MNKYGVIDEHKFSKVFTNVSDNLHREGFFNMVDGGKLIAKVPSGWKKSFNMVFVFPNKRRN